MFKWTSQRHKRSYGIDTGAPEPEVASIVDGMDLDGDRPVRLLHRPLAGGFSGEALLDSLQGLFDNDHELIGHLLDVGWVDQGLFLVYEALPGVTLRQLLRGRREALGLQRALSLIHDGLLGLVVLQRAGIAHGNVSLDSIRIMPDKRFVADLPMSTFVDLISPPANFLPLDQLGCAAPERLGEEPVNDIAGDCFALGSCFYQLLSGGALVADDDRDEAVAWMKAGNYEETELQLGTQPEGVMQVLRCALQSDRTLRYRNPNDLRHDLNMLLANCPPDRALRLLAGRESDEQAMGGNPKSSALLDVAEVERHLAAKRNGEQPTTTGDIGRQHRPMSARLKRLIKISDDFMQATIKLGPGVRVPEDLLRWILASEGVVAGLTEGGLLRAATPRQELRRVVLAEGQPARPGLPGFNVKNEEIQPPPDPVMIEVVDEGMRAIAHVVPDRPIDEILLRRKLSAAGVKRGVDEELLQRLITEGLEQHQVDIAVGVEPTPGEPAGFRLLQGSIDAEGDLLIVRRGERFAEWGAPRGGREGFTVTGQILHFDMPDGLPQELMAGPGTRIESRNQCTYLAADANGAVQRRDAGILQVVDVVRIPGGMQAGVDPDPLDTDALVVVDGDVQAGAVLVTSADCIINGNLGDAEVLVGGNLTVRGDILPGECKVSAGGRLLAQSITERDVNGADVIVEGNIRDAMVIATANIRARQATGGRLTAAESFSIEQIGDNESSATEIWAGYHLPKAVQRDLAQLHERRSSYDRDLMIQEREVFGRIIDQINHKNYMQHVLGYMRQDYRRDMYKRYEQVRRRIDHLKESMGSNQAELADNRSTIQDLDEEVVDQNAEVTITGTLHVGVTIKIGETSTRRIEKKQEQVQYRL